MQATSELDERAEKIGLGLLTCWPAVFFAIWAAQLASNTAGTAPRWLGTLAVLTALLALVLAFYYVGHAAVNDRFPWWSRAGWIALIIIGSVIAMPIYWYLHIWNEPDQKPKARPPTPRGGGT